MRATAVKNGKNFANIDFLFAGRQKQNSKKYILKSLCVDLGGGGALSSVILEDNNRISDWHIFLSP